MEKLISIKTKEYSKFFSEVFNNYTNNINISIDNKIYSEKDLNYLIKNWCSNKSIKNTKDFLLEKNNEEIIGFHDTPAELWAKYSEIDFIQRLSDKKIVKFKVLPVKKSKNILTTIFQKFLKK